MLILTLISTISLIGSIHAGASNSAEREFNRTFLVNETTIHVASPEFPEIFPGNIYSWYKLQAQDPDMSIDLHIAQFEPYNTSGSLTVYDGPRTTSPRLAVIRESLKDRHLVSSGDAMFIAAHYELTQWLYTKYSFALSSEKVNKSCGGVLHASSTTNHLTSPGYPRNYFNLQTCEWTIQSQDVTKTISIYASSVMLQDSSTCSNDLLKIFFLNDTNDELLITTICRGSVHVRSPRNTMRLRFESDSELVDKGFDITYRTIPATSCTFLMYAYNYPSYVYSPGYPESYESNLACKWTILITSTTAYSMRIQVSVELENGVENCTSSDVLVLNDRSSPVQEMAICADADPSNSTTYESIGTVVEITFHSFSNEPGPAFRVSYQRVPGPELAVNRTFLVNETSVHVLSPVPPISIRQTISIWLKLQAQDPDMNIDLHIVQFETYDDSGSLTVHDGPGTMSPRLAVFRESLKDRHLASSGDAMFIAVQYEYFGPRSFYSFAFSSEKVNKSCGGVLDASSTTNHLTSPGYPRNYFNLQTCEWTIQSQNVSEIISISASSVMLQDSATCSNDVLKIFFLNDTNNELLINTICSTNGGFVRVQSPRNTMRLRFETDSELVDKGFDISYKTMPATSCTLNLDAYNYPSYVYSPGYPESYESNLTCRWFLTSTVVNMMLRVSVELEHGPGNCTSTDVLYLIEGPFSVQQIPICADADPANSTTFETISDYIGISFQSSPNETGPAFRILYQQVPGPTTTTPTTTTAYPQNHCEDTFLTATEADQNITSPGYPDRYFSHLYCVWTIRAPRGKMIHVQVVDSELESSECRYDTVKAFDGTTNHSSLLENWCGDRAPKFQSTGNAMLIIFKTDGSINKKGFRLKFSVTETPFVCTTNVSVTSVATIYSPMYPVTYPRDMNCLWYLTAARDINIKLNVLENSFRFYGDCSLVTFSINDDSGQVGSLCGNNDRTFISSGQSMRIRFYSRSYGTTGEGFKLSAIGGDWPICESTSLRATEYYSYDLTSPRYPLSYPNNVDCTWYISTSFYDHVISLQVEVSDIEYSAGCWKDYAEAFDGKYTSSPSLGRWCGILTPTKESSGRSMTVIFHSDDSLTGGGFKISYYSKPSNQDGEGSTGFSTGPIFGGLAGGAFLLVILILCGRTYKKRKLAEMSRADQRTRPAYLTTPVGQLSTPSPAYTVGYNHQQVGTQPMDTGDYYNTAVFDSPPSYDEVIKNNTEMQLPPSYVADTSTTTCNTSDNQSDDTRL